MSQALGEQSVVETVRIQPSRGWTGVNLRELWRYRELIYFLVWRDVIVRYKQTLLGAAWAILKPLFSMVIFYIIFGRLAKVPTDNAPGPVFYFAGLLPWVLFQDGVSKAAGSLVAGSHLITKVYFPRLVVPLSAVLGGIVDFALAFLVLLGLMFGFGVKLSSGFWTLPFFILLALVAALAVGLWLSAMHVAYRDIGYVTPFMIQAWMYASPVPYSATLIPEGPWRIIYGINPMAGVIQGFRWAILGVGAPPPGMLLTSMAATLILLVTGAIYFRRMERSFADIV
jgi:lipopolysaccharide transport system permease protein